MDSCSACSALTHADSAAFAAIYMYLSDMLFAQPLQVYQAVCEEL